MTTKGLLAGTLAAVISVLSAGLVMAQEEGVKAPHIQLIEELEKEVEEARLKNEALEGKVKSLSNSVRVLAEREAGTRSELETLREQAAESNVRLELLSGALERDGQTVEQQLADAASDYKLAVRQKKEIANALLNLSDAVEAFMASTEDPAAKEKVVKSINDGEVALGLILQENRFEDKSIIDAQVVSVNKDFNLALVNVGSNQGLRVGTPVSFHRKDRAIGTALVIDVREGIAGAIFLELTDPNDQIIVGDSMRIDPEGV